MTEMETKLLHEVVQLERALEYACEALDDHGICEVGPFFTDVNALCLNNHEAICSECMKDMFINKSKQTFIRRAADA